MKLLTIQTGGTIDKEYPRRVGGYAFEIGEPAVKRVLERAQPALEVTYQTVCRKDSQDLTDDDREAMVDCVRESSEDKILITHGTDTIIDTACYIAKHVHDKSVVLCGALKPEAFKNSDADFNIGCAIGALNTVPYGVYIAVGGRVFKHDSVATSL